METLKPGEAEVFNAVKTGTLKEVQQAVEKYKEPTYTGAYHRYYLFQKKDKNNRDLLHYACIYNREDVALWILSLQDDNLGYTAIKDKDRFGVTAVMYAAKNVMIHFVKEWENLNLSLSNKDISGRNILHYCVGGATDIPNMPEETKGNNLDDILELVSYLIDKGLDFTSSDQFGKCMLQYANDNGYKDVLTYITADFNKALLLWKNENLNGIKALAQNGLHPRILLNTDPIDIYGGYIHLCVKECTTKNPKLNCHQRIDRLEKSTTSCLFNINETDDNGMTALHYVCHYDFECEVYGLREGMVAKLLEMGADPDLTDIRGYTPLMSAIEKGYAEYYKDDDPRRHSSKAIVNQLDPHKIVTEECSSTESSNMIKKLAHSLAEIKAQMEQLQNRLEKLECYANQNLISKDELDTLTETLKNLNSNHLLKS